jgi:hypothetical protein
MSAKKENTGLFHSWKKVAVFKNESPRLRAHFSTAWGEPIHFDFLGVAACLELDKKDIYKSFGIHKEDFEKAFKSYPGRRPEALKR